MVKEIIRLIWNPKSGISLEDLVDVDNKAKNMAGLSQA